MKKTLIASAVAAATLSTGVMAADAQQASIYGSVEVTYTNVDAGGATTNGVADNGSTLGFKHSHMISEGVEAFMKAEFEFRADETTAGVNNSDEIYIGVKGDFGSVQYGVDDTVVEWTDVVDTSENTGLAGEISAVSELENVQYVSPEITEGLVVGVTIPVESQSGFAGALAAKYSMDNVEVALAYSMGRDDSGAAAATPANNPEDTISLGAVYSMDDITVMGQYETQKDAADYIALQGMYAMGQNQFVLGYGVLANDGGTDESTIALQALHNVSDNMYVYAEYTTTSDANNTDGLDVDTLALGATYSF
jgi:predicted porin